MAMWVGSWKALGLAWLLCGLCAAAQANTTAAGAAPLAQNAAPDTGPLGPPTGTMVPTDLLAGPTSTPAMIRMALLLPLRSVTLGAAAQAVRDGVLAGHEREAAGVTVDVLESGDASQDVLSAYAAAVGKFDIVIGPLSRGDVAAVAQSGTVSRPTIALSSPQAPGSEAEPALPPRMLVVGLSLEDEARQVADWIGAARPGAKTFVVSTGSAWQQRAARAFAVQARQAGLAIQTMELSLASGYFSPSGLAQLKQRIAAEQPEALFVALDAQQAKQLRVAVGDEIPLYGTSQLNPLTPSDWAAAEPVNELNGVRLVDIPWQLQPDHPAVMVYPHPLSDPERKRSADLERLYALGIDAYRVARAIAAGSTSFGIDGVTGKLAVSFGDSAPGFRRIEPQAIYRDGKVQPLAGP
jgi:outer membrane PBP1 activator LpoA protein